MIPIFWHTTALPTACDHFGEKHVKFDHGKLTENTKIGHFQDKAITDPALRPVKGSLSCLPDEMTFKAVVGAHGTFTMGKNTIKSSTGAATFSHMSLIKS